LSPVLAWAVVVLLAMVVSSLHDAIAASMITCSCALCTHVLLLTCGRCFQCCFMLFCIVKFSVSVIGL
jgi:hypothetical protein